jgi:hypothetical protein
MNEEQKYKPTLSKPMNDQSKGFEKTFKKTMIQNKVNPNLNEVDEMLNEKEQSLKKKIFDLSKMEALVFSDPKLTAVYDEMAENGEEKYGYHYNETIQNMIFNDYVLNSPKYLQKYKMAIPKEKKRRDQSGINQLRKAGEEKMKKFDPEFKPKKPELDEDGAEPVTKVLFLVNETDPENHDVFAYFPEETHNGIYKSGYAHVGQHTAVHPEYAAESREATPEEYADLKAELENQVGYNLEVLNGLNETTSAGSAGGAAGYVGYAGPAAWGAGDLTKGGKSNVMRKPIWKGGRIIQESNYITDPSGFEKFVNMLNEETDSEFIPKHSQAYGTVDNMSPENQSIIRNDIEKGKLNNNSNIKGSVALQEKAKSKSQQRFMGMVNAVQKGELSSDEVGDKVEKAAKEMKPKDVKDFAKTKHKKLPEKMNEHHLNTKEDKIAFIKKGFYKLIQDATPNPERDAAQNEFLNSLSDEDIDRIYLDFEKRLGEIGIDPMSIEEPTKSFEVKEDMQTTNEATKPNRKIEKLVQDVNFLISKAYDSDGDPIGVIDSTSTWEEPYVYLPIEYSNGRLKIISYSLYNQNKKDVDNISAANIEFDGIPTLQHIGKMYRKALKQNNIKEDTQTMIQSNGSSMSNKAQATGDQSSNMEVGARAMGEANTVLDSANQLLEEINNELNAFSIHHDKLKKMSEDRKPSALVLKDRLGNENQANFKKDLQHSGTKEIIDVEKELQWKDQQTDVPKDPQKLGMDIEKKSIKVTDATGDEHLKNVGDSANDEGDEIPKRNLKTKEQEEVDMYRLGQQSLVYDNEPGKRFEDRMKADMGENMSKIREKQLKFRGEAPMYNKDPQPVEDTTAKKVQFDKEQTGWNEREGLKESMITGRYKDILGKRRLIDFTLNEVEILKTPDGTARQTGLFKLDFTGLGNAYNSKTVDYKVSVNESVANVLNTYSFYTDSEKVFAMKNPAQKLTEGEVKEKPVVNEQVDKMKHLLGYKPESFTNTTNVKKNRGF